MVQLGRVTSVTVDEQSADIFVNVALTPRSEGRQMRFLTPASGMWIVPHEGDVVEVAETDREFVARFPHSAPPFEIPDSLAEGDFAFKFDDDTEIRVQRSDERFDVHVRASGAVHVDGQEIDLGEAGVPLITGLEVQRDGDGNVTDVIPEYTDKTRAE